MWDFDFDLILSLKEIGEEGEMIATDMVGEDECIPFPHEAHQVLTQEILHVFSAGALVAAGISSGLSVLGGLLGGARVVAICSSKSHQKYVQKNVTQWLKEKKLVHSCSSGNRRKDVVARAQRPSQWRPRPMEAAHPQLRMLVPVSAQAPMEAAQAQLRMLVLQVPMEDQGGVCWVPLEMFRCEAAS